MSTSEVNIPFFVQNMCHLTGSQLTFNPFNPEFTIVIFIHYKPRIAAAILDL